ncbi:MAG: winged helix-turn-helix transcriptional regulator [Opitutaceae bacterium]|nr:winged helix-turn-helix transcriptional regulator [Opitutaceae bacterium]
MLSLAALSDPTRRRIIELLAKEEYAAGEIVAEFDLSAPAISQHLKLLRDAGLVVVRIEGQRRVYAVNPQGFAELDAWLHRMHGLWAALPASPAPLKPVRARSVRGKRVRPPAPVQAPEPEPQHEIIMMETP